MTAWMICCLELLLLFVFAVLPFTAKSKVFLLGLAGFIIMIIGVDIFYQDIINGPVETGEIFCLILAIVGLIMLAIMPVQKSSKQKG